MGKSHSLPISLRTCSPGARVDVRQAARTFEAPGICPNSIDATAAGKCVPALDFMDGSPPRYLYTSGRPGRCNPRDVDCLYFSESERVADLEYRRRFLGLGAATEPRLTFFAQVDLKHVVDLSRPTVLKTLGISADDVLTPWRTVSSPTRLQRLGLAISGRQRNSLRVRCSPPGWNEGVERRHLSGCHRDARPGADPREGWRGFGGATLKRAGPRVAVLVAGSSKRVAAPYPQPTVTPCLLRADGIIDA